MQITKGDLVNRALSIIRISGIVIDPSPEEVSLSLQEADDLGSELVGRGLAINWQSPLEYGSSDPADNSGLVPAIAGGFSSVLALRLLDLFGKPVTQTLMMRAEQGHRSLEHYGVRRMSAYMPSTLPRGSGNTGVDQYDNQFYKVPPASGETALVGESRLVTYDFSDWLLDETLMSVVWSVIDGNISITDDIIDDTETKAQALVAFSQPDRARIKLTATKTNSLEVKEVVLNYIIKQPTEIGYAYT